MPKITQEEFEERRKRRPQCRDCEAGMSGIEQEEAPCAKCLKRIRHLDYSIYPRKRCQRHRWREFVKIYEGKNDTGQGRK